MVGVVALAIVIKVAAVVVAVVGIVVAIVVVVVVAVVAFVFVSPSILIDRQLKLGVRESEEEAGSK